MEPPEFEKISIVGVVACAEPLAAVSAATPTHKAATTRTDREGTPISLNGLCGFIIFSRARLSTPIVTRLPDSDADLIDPEFPYRTIGLIADTGWQCIGINAVNLS